MTKAIAGTIIIVALAYVAMRLTFYVARLWDDRRRARAEVERLTAAVERVRALADRIDRHTEVEPDPVMFRDADTGVWWEVSDALRAALDGVD